MKFLRKIYIPIDLFPRTESEFYLLIIFCRKAKLVGSIWHKFGTKDTNVTMYHAAQDKTSKN
jgi:hypothetical protein